MHSVAAFCAVLFFFAGWTASVHVCTLAGLPFAALYGALAFGVGCGWAGVRAAPKFAEVFLSDEARLPRVSFRLRALRSQSSWFWVASVVLGAAFVGAAWCQYHATEFLPLWTLCVVGALGAVAYSRRRLIPGVVEVEEETGDAIPRWFDAGVGVFVLALAGMFWMTSFPDADDALFLNFAVGAREHRDAILVTDTMLGIPDLAMIKSTYRLESYPMLAAAVSDILGVKVITAAHFVVPVLSCVLAGTTLALVYLALLGRWWVAGCAAHVAWSLAFGGAVQSFGMHAVPRFTQGKGPLVFALLPLICFLAAVSIRRRSVPALVLGATAVVAAIGCSANALYVVPLAVALIAAPRFVFARDGARWTALRTSIFVVYPMALALFVLLTEPPLPSEIVSAGPTGDVFWTAIGGNYTHAFSLLCLCAAAMSALAHPAFRAISAYVALLLVCVVNPFLWDAYGEFVTGNVNYRLLWVVPIPAVLAAATVVVARHGSRYVQGFIGALIVLALVGPASLVPKLSYGFSVIKVPDAAFAVAERANAMTPPRALILAPEAVSTWIPTLDDARPVVESRGLYATQRTAWRTSAELHDRQSLFRWVTDGVRGERSDADWIRLAMKYHVAALVVQVDSSAHRAMRAHGPTFGFVKHEALSADYEVFMRADGYR